MKWLLLALLTITQAHTNPLTVIVHPPVNGLLVASVSYEGDPQNTDIMVAVKALDHTPPQWADATVYHVWFVDGGKDGHEDDQWPNMPAGRYRVWVTLHRANGFHVTTPTVDVEVK